MINFFKRAKANLLISAIIYTLLGLFLLLLPDFSARVLCTALGMILLACGLGDISVFLLHRDGSLYSALHLVCGIVLAVVGIWLVARPTLIAVVIPRIIGLLICVHGGRNLGSALSLRKQAAPRWNIALLLAAITLLIGIMLVLIPFDIFTSAIRLIGLFLIYDGISDLWILSQTSKAKQLTPPERDLLDAVDADFKDVEFDK